MNKMKFSNLSFNKVCITYHNGKEYFLYYQSLIQCIKNILTVSNITQNFALSYENYEREEESIYKEQNNGMWWKNTKEQVPNYYHLFYIRMQQLQIHWVKADIFINW